MPPEGSSPSAPCPAVTIAGLACIRLTDPHGLLPDHPIDSFGPAPEAEALELSLELTREPAPVLTGAKKIFDSTSLWKVRRLGPAYAFQLPHLTAVVDFSARSGRIHLRDQAGPAFSFPLDQVIFSRLLAEQGLVVVHACGVATQGPKESQGLLLAGPSGVGKSTLADLWAKSPGAQVLSDDRVAVGLQGDRALMAGTPWHGTARHASDRVTDLSRILMLEQAPENRYRPLPASEAAARFLSMCVIPYWHPPSAELALDVALRLASRIPLGVQGFVPDESAVAAMAELTPVAGFA